MGITLGMGIEEVLSVYHDKENYGNLTTTESIFINNRFSFELFNVIKFSCTDLKHLTNTNY